MSFLWIQKFRLKISKSLFFTLKFYFLIGFSCALGQNQKIADSLIALQRDVLNDTTQLNVLNEIAFNHTNPDIILAYSDTLLALAQKGGHKRWVQRGYFRKGNAYRLKGDLKKATECFYEGARISKEINFQTGLGAAYLALGDVYSLNNDHSNSKKYYHKAINIYRVINDSINLASAILNLGDEYFNVGKLDSALSYFNESEKIFKDLDYEIGIAYSLGNKGLVYAKQNKNQLAEQNIKQANAILKKLGDKYPIAVHLTYMADIYREKGDIERALSYGYKSLSIAKEGKFKEQIRDASLKLSELYSAKKVFDSAYHYQSQYLIYRDSVSNEETIRKMADLRTEYEVAQKQAEIDLLTQTEEKHQIIAISLVVVVFLIGILAFVQFRNNKVKQAINNRLLQQKAALQQQHDQLEVLNQTKDRFFSIISHDLRGPVNAFNGISSLIKHYVDSRDMVQLVEVTEYIDKSASQLSTLLDNLLDWAINQQGTFPHNPQKILFKELVEETFEIFRTTAHAKNIYFKVEVEKELMLWADRNSLTTILRNLVNNALKFTKPKGSVTINAFSKQKWGIIEVIDTGIGIPSDKLASLFELIEKKNTPGTAGEKGLGLGLQLAYDFSVMNEGTIGVESEEKVGTKFTVKIPLFENDNKSSNSFLNNKVEIFST